LRERAKKYQRFAEECLRIAARVNDEAIRAAFLLMAQVWHRVAHEIEEDTDEPASPMS
jgi:hypothetical protein